jgi:hypothetical protein
MVLALFGPTDEITAIFYIAAVVCFVLAAVVAPAAVGRVRRSTDEAPRASFLPVGSLFLIALGLALWLFPAMWQTCDAAF